MGVVEVTCPDCQDIRIKVSQIKVVTCLDLTDHKEGVFFCPICCKLATKLLDPHQAAQLKAMGAKEADWSLPVIRREERCGSPITEDDVVAFKRRLRSDEAIEEALHRIEGGQ